MKYFLALIFCMSSGFTLPCQAHKEMWQKSNWMIYEYCLAIENDVWEIEDRIYSCDRVLYDDDLEFLQVRIDRIRCYLHGFHN